MALPRRSIRGFTRPDRIRGQLRDRGTDARAAWQDSEIRESHRDNDPRVQDAYSLRCTPQVLGAVADAIRFARETAAIELNASTDNPLVFENGDVLSGGNFHGQPVAQALDFLGDRLDDPAGLAERRVERLVNPDLSQGLPAFLTGEPGTLLGLHDGADHRRLSGGGVPDPGDAGQHRIDPHRCQPGGLRPDGHGRSLEGAPDSGQRANGDRRPSCSAPHRAWSSCGRSARGRSASRCTSACVAPRMGCRPSAEDRPPAPDLERLARLVMPGSGLILPPVCLARANEAGPVSSKFRYFIDGSTLSPAATG